MAAFLGLSRDISLHTSVDVVLSHVSPSSTLEFAPCMASDPERSEDLANFAVSFYCSGLEGDELLDWNRKYDGAIDTAIKSSNLLGLAILWQVVYKYDLDAPDAEGGLYTAIEHSSLEMVQYTLYCYGNYPTINGVSPLKLSEIEELSAKNPNPEVKEYIASLRSQVDRDGIIYPPEDE